ncbi:hypothetical protein Tco_1299994 [Tanacetum coccineum]
MGAASTPTSGDTNNSKGVYAPIASRLHVQLLKNPIGHVRKKNLKKGRGVGGKDADSDGRQEKEKERTLRNVESGNEGRVEKKKKWGRTATLG